VRDTAGTDLTAAELFPKPPAVRHQSKQTNGDRKGTDIGYDDGAHLPARPFHGSLPSYLSGPESLATAPRFSRTTGTKASPLLSISEGMLRTLGKSRRSISLRTG
jgi:hypothetical protein